MSPRNYYNKFSHPGGDNWWGFSKSEGYELPEDKAIKNFFKSKWSIVKKIKNYKRTSDFK